MKIQHGLFLLLFTAFGCKTSAPSGGFDLSGDWLIPESQVLDGGVGKDGIPAISNPAYESISDADTYLDANDLVMVAQSGNEVHLYPHPILDWHEIINDAVGTEKVAVTYCPLTGTGIGWNRVLGGSETTFGVSGFLYNSNLVPYDRKTNSIWSQIRMDCVNGEFLGEQIELVPLLETSWATAKKRFPNAVVVDRNSGAARNYDRYPYGDYKTSSQVSFPITRSDNRLHEKERVLSIIDNNEEAVVYRFQNFPGNQNGAINDDVFGKKTVIFGNNTENFMIAFERTLDGETLEFTAINDGSDAIAQDATGSRWDVFGNAISGLNEGKKLTPLLPSFMAYWFSIPAFYENTEIR